MKKTSFTWAVVVLSLLGLIVSGCSKSPDQSHPDAAKVVIAEVDGRAITSDVLEKYLATRPVPMNADNSAEMLKKRVDEIIVDEMLYQEALRLKLDQEPDTRQRIRQVLNQKLSEEQINKKAMQRKIEPAELQAYYDSHLDEFNRPEMVRLADILIAVPKDAAPEQKAERKQKAESVLAEIMAASSPSINFPQIARKYSDQPEKYPKGDTGFFSQDGKPIGMDPAVVEAGFKLEKSGDIANAVVEAGDGFHIIMQIGKHPAFNRPFDQVAKYLERRIRNEELQKRREEYVQELKAKSKITMDEKALAQVQEKLKTSGKMRPMPPVNRPMPPLPAGAGNPVAAPPNTDTPPPPAAMGGAIPVQPVPPGQSN